MINEAAFQRFSYHRPYPAYKDSGIEWLGEVPEHWEVKRTKTLLSRNNGGVWGMDFDDEGVVVLRSTEQTVDGEWDIRDPAKRRLTPSEYAACRLIDGDLVVTKSSGSALHIGKTSIVTRDIEALNCCHSNFMQRLRVKKNVAPRYMWYVLNGELGRKQFGYYSDTTTGLANLNAEIIGMVHLAVAPLPEQRAIAAFLDRETAKIDALIAKVQKAIDLLKEQRNALITQAVTKGLDPDVPLKDSGVEWLGEIPEHWEVKKVTRLFEIGSGTTPPTDYADYYGGDIAWITTSELRESVVMSTKKTVTREALKAFSTLNVYPEGSVAVAMYGATIGRIGVLGTEAAVNQACCVFSRPNGIDVWFWFYWLQHRRSYLISLGYGGGQPNLSQDLLKAIRVPIPPLPEQRTIAAFLDRETAKIDALVAKIRKVIDLLKEQRTALISAAVTGKIDVREAMA